MNKLLKLSFLFVIVALFMTSCKKDGVLQNNNVTPETPTVTQNIQQVNSLVTSDSAGCYEIVFPIIFIMDDGSSVTVDSETDLETVFGGTSFPVNLGFPVNLTDPATGENVTAADEAELDNYLSECEYGDDPIIWGNDTSGVEYGFLGCYDLVYPVSFTLADGTTATANTEADLVVIFDDNNPPTGFVYPLNLENTDTNEAATANDDNELNELLLLCDDFGGGGGNGGGICDSLDFNSGFLGCYDLVFPVSFTLQDGTTATANTEDDLATIFTNNNPPTDFAYPLSLQNIITEEFATANSEEELIELLAACDTTGIGSGGGNWGQGAVHTMTIITVIPDSSGFAGCYDFQYPVSVVDVDGNVLTANDDDAMMQNVFGNVEIADFVYPINVTETSSGQTLTANNEDEMITWIADCN